ncbi:DNA/RNA-binding protein KIN17 [Conger conger]|uniref:DNA/RNA-binding protein KIN17 n=1 Tax=Conger conger TaxID=82655 RepID=UPI002A5A31A5|nr:DNA/RNA-binding protein KIN17 [Conger conger]
MGKAEFLSPKAIGNRIKAKGLQKLRWYCQMCQKQCRDENGFKCHCMSESHQRQLLLASEDPNQFMDYFSQEFKSDFLELLRRRFGTKRVHNNIVYNEYISDREHIHMNSTQWETLTDFTKWLGKEASEAPVFTELKRENEEEKVAFNLSKGVGAATASSSKASSALGPSALQAMGSVKRKAAGQNSESKEKEKKKSALDEIMQMEEQKKKSVRADHWLYPDIVVKVVTKKLGEKYHKKKGVIKEVQDKYSAIVKMSDTGDKLKLDQSHLETVIPALGKRVLILNGVYRETEAILDSIDERRFSANLILDSGRQKGRKVEGIAYEDFSKMA